MALYNQLRRRDIILMCADLLQQNVLVQRDVDGKLDFKNPAPSWDVPWHFTVQKGNLNCLLWSRLMFHNIFKKIPDSIINGQVWIPSGCQNCFKVVVRPQTLKQLFALVDLQKKLDIDAKCGVEHRAYVFGNYGGYFYNRGMEQGLETYNIVREAINEYPGLGPDVKVILKRACTEMEMANGPSDKWEISKEQVYIEDLIYSSLNIDNRIYRQTRAAIDYVHGRWIEYAYQWGDDTVFEYLDPERPMYKPLVTYHHLSDQKEDNK